MSGALVWKILTAPEWARLHDQGRFAGTALDLADGFIHLSAEAQLAGTLDAHFSGVSGLFLVGLDPAGPGSALRWEASRGGALFPHLYGMITLDQVAAQGPLRRGADGAVILPLPHTGASR